MKYYKNLFFSLLFLSFCFVSSNVFALVKFSKGCEIIIVKLIDDTKIKLDMAVYAITLDSITDAILRAKERGVKIRIITDKQQSFGRSSKALYLHKQGINIIIDSKFKLLHHKFNIFDDEIVESGSFNLTKAAAESNAEDCRISNKQEDKEDLKTFIDRFEYLWSIEDRDKSEEYLKRIEKKRREKLGY